MKQKDVDFGVEVEDPFANAPERGCIVSQYHPSPPYIFLVAYCENV